MNDHSVKYLTSRDAVVVSKQSIESPEARAIVQSNIDFVNALFAAFLKADEVSRDALRSYYVDYYLCQVLNGGFAQFVYNSSWGPETIRLVKEGLSGMGAVRHASLFSEGEALVAAKPSAIRSFFASAFFGKNKERDRLNRISDKFMEIEQGESLEDLNAAWLKSRPDLRVVDEGALSEEVQKRAAAIEDLAVRQAAALAAEPRFKKMIRALCNATGQTLERITAGDPTNEYEGRRIVAWHFITDKGHHFMVDLGDRAIMFVGKTKEKLTEIEVDRGIE